MENNLDQIFRYLFILNKRKGLFFLVSFALMTVLVIGCYFIPKKYKADSTVFIETSVIEDLVRGLVVTQDMEEKIRVLRYALLSRGLITDVLKELDVDVKFKTDGALQGYVTSLQSRTQLTQRREDLFILSIEDRDPHFAQRYINTLVQKYLEQSSTSSREETYGANRFLEEQLVVFKDKLDKAEDRIIKFRNQEGVFLSLDEPAIIANIRDYNRQIDDNNLEIATQSARKNELAKQLKTISPEISLFSEGERANRLEVLEARIKYLMVSYTENYPEVIKLKAELEAHKRNLKEGKGVGPSPSSLETRSTNPVYQETRQAMLNAATEISALRARQARLQNMILEKEKELKFIPENTKKLGMMIQERDSYRRIYQDLLARMGQSEVSKQMEIGDKTTTFRVVDPAVFPENPVSPKMVRMILLAIVAGFGGGLGIVLLLEMLDNSVKEVRQIQELNFEVLAIIPRISTAVQERAVQLRDRKIFIASGLYFSCIVCVLVFEVLK
jgi:protein tyrosine kinase modulator